LKENGDCRRKKRQVSAIFARIVFCGQSGDSSGISPDRNQELHDEKINFPATGQEELGIAEFN